MPKYVLQFDDRVIKDVYRSGRVNLLLCALLSLMAIIWMITSLRAADDALPEGLNSSLDAAISASFVIAYVALAFSGLFLIRGLTKGPWAQAGHRVIGFIYLSYMLIAANLFFGLGDVVAFNRQANNQDYLNLTDTEQAAAEGMSTWAQVSFAITFVVLAVAIWALVAHHKGRNSMLIELRKAERQRRLDSNSGTGHEDSDDRRETSSASQ